MKTYKARAAFEGKARELRETTKAGNAGDFMLVMGGWSIVIPRAIFLMLFEEV